MLQIRVIRGQLSEPCGNMLHMERAYPTTGIPTRSPRWAARSLGLLAGAAVMGLVTWFLSVIAPLSDAAWLVPLFGIPAALAVGALVPVRRGRTFRSGMSWGALLWLVVFMAWFVANVPYA